MRTDSGEPDADSGQPAPDPESWLVGELRSGIEGWDPGSAAFDRVMRLARRRRAARRRYAVTAGLAAVACALLLFVVLPDSRITAGNATGSVSGVQTPMPSVPPSERPISASASPIVRPPASPPVVAPPRQVPKTAAPATAPPVDGSRPPTPAATSTPLTAGARKSASPDSSSSPSPSLPGGHQPICILGLLCL